jgi:hypothetical protein
MSLGIENWYYFLHFAESKKKRDCRPTFLMARVIRAILLYPTMNSRYTHRIR